MLLRLRARILEKAFQSPGIKRLLVRSVLTARESLDWLRDPIEKPAFRFDKAKSLYPRLAHDFMKIADQIDTHPHYLWGALNGVSLAKALKIDRVSVIEFGVGGGRGLVALDKMAAMLEEMYGVKIDVYGFDMATGLPKPRDYRDLPNLWSEGYYATDPDHIRKYLKRAKLIVGDVQDTIRDFVRSSPAPVAFIGFDLDLYSSTRAAFQVFETDLSVVLPRVHCYFDDVHGFTAGEYIGERLAIREFNEAHPMRKISQTFGVKYFVPEPFAREMWTEMMYLAHFFDHPLYTHNDGLVRGADPGYTLERPGPNWTRMAR